MKSAGVILQNPENHSCQNPPHAACLNNMASLLSNKTYAMKITGHCYTIMQHTLIRLCLMGLLPDDVARQLAYDNAAAFFGQPGDDRHKEAP